MILLQKGVFVLIVVVLLLVPSPGVKNVDAKAVAENLQPRLLRRATVMNVGVTRSIDLEDVFEDIFDSGSKSVKSADLGD